MKYIYIIPVLTFFALSSRGQTPETKDDVGTSFQEMLDNAVSDSKLNIAGVSMTVMAPELEISWTGAAGYDSLEKDTELSDDQPFRIASITKTFVAAAILRLQERGKLAIDDPISKYISETHKNILIADRYDPETITIKQCLLHRSGLYDYAMGGEDYVATVMQNPAKRWTRTEQLQFAMDHGDPLGVPGSVYSYSDTGYVLLGETLEKVTGKPLGTALRDLLQFEALGLGSTWLESLETRPAGIPDPVHRYFQTMDATEWDNSIDLYGGGGIASTTKDLSIFFSALFNGQVFKEEGTLHLMLEDAGAVEKRQGPESYRLGLWQIDVFDAEGFMHNGFWGTAWAHIPNYNVTIAVNYTNDSAGAGLLPQVVSLLKEQLDANN